MLTAKQKKFIPEYLKIGCIKTTCKNLKMDESTYFRWRNDVEFMAELKKRQDELYNTSIDKLKNLSGSAIDTLKELLGDDVSSIRLRAAIAILDNNFKFIDNKELRERLEALEELIEKEKTKQ